MSSEKTLAIVLRVVEFSESSYVVTLFTQDFGKISALAKGARRPKGPFESALDLLSLCRIVFIQKSSDALDLLTEAKLERRFRAASRDLARLYAGYYVLELLDQLTDRSDPHPELFEAGVRTVVGLDENASVAEELLRFEYEALRLLGHLPSWNRCVGCDTTIDTTTGATFGLLAGGVLCHGCRHQQRRLVRVSAESLRVLQHYSTVAESWQGYEIPKQCRGEIRGLTNQYFCNLLGKPLRMQRHLGLLNL